MPNVLSVGKSKAGMSPSWCSNEGKRRNLAVIFPDFLDLRRVNAGVGGFVRFVAGGL